MSPGLARSTDPETSHMAAKALQVSIGRLQRRVLQLIQEHPDRTARELERIAEAFMSPADTVHKRLSELREMGKIVSRHRRQCSVTGRIAQTWRATRGHQ